MIYTAMIDLDERTILNAETIPDDQEEYASLRYSAHEITARLEMRDHPEKHYAPYRGDKPFTFLPATDEEVAAAMSATDASGVDALSTD